LPVAAPKILPQQHSSVMLASSPSAVATFIIIAIAQLAMIIGVGRRHRIGIVDIVVGSTKCSLDDRGAIFALEGKILHRPAARE